MEKEFVIEIETLSGGFVYLAYCYEFSQYSTISGHQKALRISERHGAKASIDWIFANLKFKSIKFIEINSMTGNLNR